MIFWYHDLLKWSFKMKKIIISIASIITVGITFSAAYSATKNYNQKTYQTGDIVFQTTKGKIAAVASSATLSKYTHVGMIVMKRGKPYVIEANGPVRYVSLKRFIKRGVGSRVTIMRLKNLLTKKQKRKLVRQANKYLGKGYDSRFRWSDKRMYCSELVYKVYNRGLKISLNKPQKIGDFYSPLNPISIAYAKKAYGKKIPMDEKVVSPARIYRSDKLIKVFDNYPII